MTFIDYLERYTGGTDIKHHEFLCVRPGSILHFHLEDIFYFALKAGTQCNEEQNGT